MADLQPRLWHRFPAPLNIVQRSMMHGVNGMSVLNLLNSVREAFADWRRREHSYAEMMALDDHSLADIGIRRSDIRAICEGSHRPAPSEALVPFPQRGEFAKPDAHLMWACAQPETAG